MKYNSTCLSNFWLTSLCFCRVHYKRKKFGKVLLPMCINRYKTIEHKGYSIFLIYNVGCYGHVTLSILIELNYFECPRVIHEIWHFILIPGFHTNNIATNCKFLSYTHTRNIRNTRASNHAHSNTLFMSKINGCNLLNQATLCQSIYQCNETLLIRDLRVLVHLGCLLIILVLARMTFIILLIILLFCVSVYRTLGN